MITKNPINPGDMALNKWQIRIKITQIPAEIGTELMFDYENRMEESHKKTLLTNPFRDQTIYGLEIGIKNEFSWTFFLCDKTCELATAKGFTYLNYLQMEYPGLDGTIEVVPIDSLELNASEQLYELVLPMLPQKFELFSKIVQLFRSERIGDLSLYFFWQRDDSVQDFFQIPTSIQAPTFKIKIYLKLNPYNLNNTETEIHNGLYTGLYTRIAKFLTLNIENRFTHKASLSTCSPEVWYNIIKCDHFLNNPDRKITGWNYKYYWNKLPQTRRFTVIYPYLIDFSFPDNSPLRKANLLKSTNLSYNGLTIEDNNSIWVGWIVNNATVENNPATIPIDHFAKSTFIGGQMGTGKTYLLCQIANEFYKKAPHVGILYLNTGKPDQEKFYRHDICLKYGDPRLNIPYYIQGPYQEKSIQETAAYLAASAGLREPVDKILKKVMKSFIRVNGKLPDSLRKLFKGLRKWYTTHRYDDKFHARITTAIENRVLSLLSDPTLIQCTKLIPGNKSPRWFTEWQNGKKVYIDLSMCDAYVKLMLTNAIFQLIRSLTPNRETGTLQHLIVIDEAHVILEKSNDLFTNSDFYVTKEQLEHIFNSLLREFRSKGLGFILCDVVPSDLFMNATKLPSLKILFRLGEQCARRFTTMADDYRYLMMLESRQALILNGNNGERYPIRTIELTFRKQKKNIA